MAAPEQVRLLLVWLAENLEVEPLSGLMPWGPIWNVQVVPLLEQIGAIWGLSAQEIGAVVNPVRERVEEDARHGLS